MLTYELLDWDATVCLGQALARHLCPRDRVFLRGDLGSGKTALAGAIVRALGYRGAVKSPTYTLVEEYELGSLRVIHADLYRLKAPAELETLGWWDYLDERTLTLVEWPEQAGNLLQADIDVFLTVTDHARQAQLRGVTRRGAQVIDILRP